MQKEKIKKVSFNKSGTGGVTPKLTLPAKWLEDMGVTEEEREVKVKYKTGDKGKRIIITKYQE